MNPPRRLGHILVLGCLLFIIPIAAAQTTFVSGQLDPTRNIGAPQRIDRGHTPLPEQYIWTAPSSSAANKAASKTAPRYFRAEFNIAKRPVQATLYIAGVEASEVYINGKLADKAQRNPSSALKMGVLSAHVGRFLHTGKNVLALKVSPGRSLSDGHRYLLVKIVPRAKGVDAPALLASGPAWKGTLHAASGWQSPTFDDANWVPVHAFGPVESSLDFYQGNDDAGLYQWPGYIGASPFLAHVTLPAQKVEQVFTGRSNYANVDALTGPPAAAAAKEFTVHLTSRHVAEQDAPSLLLDFGKEVSGRVEFISAASQPAQITVQYGESREEALNQPYLGVDPLTVPPHATAYGPKSAFRYAKVRFLGGGPTLPFKFIGLDDIYYPVQYRGSFDSSDPLLNRIWEVGAYTAHLCMQDDIWDATKRDRMRWAGDLDVSGRAIEDIFDDHALMEDTMTRLVGNAPVKNHVNDIPGYSAWWISEERQYFLHSGSLKYLESIHPQLVQLLNYMDTELDSKDLYANKTHAWPFVDWSPELNGDHPEAFRATEFEFYLGYRDGAFLLRQLGDTANADKFEQRAAVLKQASQKYLLDTSTDTYGSRWQTNSIAVVSGVARRSQYAPIWDRVLSTVNTTKYTAFVTTPYYGYYILSAMAETGHRPQALQWIRDYWGGMLAEGATSFWEGYDPSWPKRNFHASLQADDGTGYYVSLAHGWSTGPTAWMMEQILGIHPTAVGFSQVTIRPDLAGLAWAKGAEPTPHGLLKVSLRGAGISVDVPAGVEATVLVPVARLGQVVLVNGKPAASSEAPENGTRAAVVLKQPGQYTLRAQ